MLPCSGAAGGGVSQRFSSGGFGFPLLRYYSVSSVFMGLNVGDNMFLGQHLLYDKIITEKTAYNQRSLDTFQRRWVQRQ